MKVYKFGRGSLYPILRLFLFLFILIKGTDLHSLVIPCQIIWGCLYAFLGEELAFLCMLLGQKIEGVHKVFQEKQ